MMVVNIHRKRTSAWAARTKARELKHPASYSVASAFSYRMRQHTRYQDRCWKCVKTCKVVSGGDFVCMDYVEGYFPKNRKG